jgi:predicted DNA-binding protein
MTRKASTFRIAPPVQSALETLSRVLKRPMNQLVNEALQDYLERRSLAAERDLELTLARLRAYRKRDPHFKAAIGAVVDAEASYGKEDPAEGMVVETPAIEGTSPLRTEIRRILNAS